MNCPNCGNFNSEGFKFCIKCGNSLETNSNPEEKNIVAEEVLTEQLVQPVQEEPVKTDSEPTIQSQNINVQERDNSSNGGTYKSSFIEYFSMILAVILKPFTFFKEQLNKFDDFKNSAIISLIVSGSATIINLIVTMINSVIERSYSWMSGSYSTTIAFENLKDLNYFELIGKNFLIYLGAIVAISGVYYLASLIIKKQVKFPRLLGISAVVVVPLLASSLLISPLLSLIWSGFSMPITLIGAVYTIILLYEGMNSEITLEGDNKYYFNLICFSIIGIGAYYLFINLLMSSISGGLGDIMDMFG